LRWEGSTDVLFLSLQRTGKVPKALEDRPYPGPDTLFYLECFYALSRHRQSNGFGPSQLDIPSIKIYADAIGYGEAEFEWFLYMMAELDQEYLSFVNEKRSAESQTKAAQRPKR
jgi:hypothetical protein